MSITRYIEEAKKLQNNHPSKEEEQQDIALLSSVLKKQEQLSHSQFNFYGFNYKTYKELLILASLAINNEMFSRFMITQTDLLHQASFAAYKLTILFGDTEQAKAYLKRFEKSFPGGGQPFHDACLFKLPIGDKWDIHLWREIINNSQPAHPEHPILKILPHAEKIEAYLKQYPDKVIAAIKQDITSEHEERLSREHDNLIKKTGEKNVWIQEQLNKNKRLIYPLHLKMRTRASAKFENYQ